MKKAIIYSLLLLLCLFLFKGPVSAQDTDSTTATTETNITTNEVTTITEETTITKSTEIGINQDVTVAQSSETSNMGNVGNSDNQINETNTERSATVWGSAFNGVNGIISVNQAPGTLNNQGNSVSISFAKEDHDILVQSSSAFNQSNTGNSVNVEDSVRSTAIEANAFNLLSGIVSINQSSGNMNNQNTMISVSIGGSPVVSLSSADLNVVSAGNTVFETGARFTDVIRSFAFEGVSGIVSINQSSGNMNNQVNVVTISIKQFDSLNLN